MSGTKVVEHAAGIKIKEGDSADTWVWYELLDSGTDIYGTAHSSCTTCHKSKQISDYMASKPD